MSGIGRALGAVTTGAAAGAATGLAAERYLLGRHRLRPDPLAGEPLGGLGGTVRTVAADDGIPLQVEELPASGAAAGGAPTLVFTHGYCLDRRCWHFQRRALQDVARLVFWDHRSHGRSGRSPSAHSTIDWLGRDLFRVLEALAPDGPVVLVGHSMGGMTVMALAQARPELFGERIVGVGLLGTSAGKLGEVTFGLPAYAGMLLRRTAPEALRRLRRRAALVDRGRHISSDLAFVLTKWYSFGSDVSPSLVQFVERMVASTPIDVVADFYDTFAEHDKLAALDVLRDVQALVLVGENDLLTPADHSRSIAQAVPAAELVVVPRTGHLVQLERPDVVNAALRDLVRRSRQAVAA